MGSVLEKDTYMELTYIFRKFMDPHGSQVENAILKEERVTDETRNMALGISCCWVGGSFENSWRSTIKQSSLSLKTHPLLKVLLPWDPQMKTSWGLKESDNHSQKHHSS